jgi:hypothetical protein
MFFVFPLNLKISFSISAYVVYQNSRYQIMMPEGDLTVHYLGTVSVKHKYIKQTMLVPKHWLQGAWYHKGNNKITELRTILQRESQNS